MKSKSFPTLQSRLADELPINSRFTIHHLSSPPTPCPAIYSAPQGQKPEKTFCESHFLSVSIDRDESQLQVFALEVLVFTTKYLTTLFVSKADSTGYLHLLNLPRGTPSPIRTISSTFLGFLIERRQRPDRRLVVSLFARAQDQYLFPGSIENRGKHVLDDRGLVRWWCQVLDPIFLRYPVVHENSAEYAEISEFDDVTSTAQGYLRVPGCDTHETRSFFPKRQQSDSSKNGKWKSSDPLRDIGRSPTLPERCLIPRFPDDPKARFVDELDEELPQRSPQSQRSSKRKQSGRWKSVRSLDQFWEMMAFRQECSSGRLVGFLWGVFTPIDFINIKTLDGPHATLSRTKDSAAVPDLREPGDNTDSNRSSSQSSPDINILPPPSTLLSTSEQDSARSVSKKSTSTTKPLSIHDLTGPIINREPRTLLPQPEKTKHYSWPASSRGNIVLRERDYHRINKLLLHLDYATMETAVRSTMRWINDVAVVGGVQNWGYTIEGRKEAALTLNNSSQSNATVLDMGLIRKKKRVSDNDGPAREAKRNHAEREVNILPSGFVRKKAKVTLDNTMLSEFSNKNSFSMSYSS